MPPNTIGAPEEEGEHADHGHSREDQPDQCGPVAWATPCRQARVAASRNWEGHDEREPDTRFGVELPDVLVL